MGFEALYDNASVRRRDRLLSAEEAAGVLRRGEYGFLAMQDAGGGAYGVPISYVWDGGSRIYLHCAPEGRKLSCLERHPEVTFCVVGATHVVGRKFTTAYVRLIAERNPGMTRVMIGDALVNEDARLQLRMNQFFDRVELTLRQCLRLAATQGQSKEDMSQLKSNLIMSYVIGKLFRFVKTQFREKPTDGMQAQINYILA